MRKIRLLTLSGLFFLPPFAVADQSPALFHSPKGQFDIRFQPQAHRLYPTPYERALPPGVQSQVYSVSFYLAGKDSPAAITYFTDIQRSPDEKFPTPLDVFVKRMFWSPDEDFVVLPAEGWPTGNGEVIPPQAVSLRTRSVWQFVDFPLEQKGLIWLNPLQAIGNSTAGCRIEVKEFDGHSGRTLAYQSADPPQGYEILSANETTVVLKKVLGDCATDSDRKNFHAECMVMNISFGRGEIGACPP